MAILIKQIQFSTQDYQNAVQLRYETLRKPLGLQFKAEDLAQEYKDFHVAAFLEEKVVGVLLLKPLDNSEIKMRQVAVSEKNQGQGIGKKLVKFAENLAREKSFNWIVLNARETALELYLSLGYEIVGEAFSEVNIPHRAMRKKIR